MNDNGGGLLDGVFEWVTIAYIYIKTHYYFYSGSMIRIFLDPKMGVNLSTFRYVMVCLFLVPTTHELAFYYGAKETAIFLCLVVGFIGHTFLKFILDDFIQDFMTAVKKRIIDAVNKK